MKHSFHVGSRAAIVLVLGLGCRLGASATPDKAAPTPTVAASQQRTSTTAQASTTAAGWTRVTEEDGIAVTSRPSEHSPLPVFRGVGRVDAPLLDVLAVISDADRHHEWVFSCSASSLVAQTSDLTAIVYNRTATPWPVPDRDVVLRSRVEVIDGEREAMVRFSATTHAKRPAQDGVVRMSYLHGHYHLWAEDDAHTRVEYQVDSDPGGSLPTRLATRGTREMPLETLRGLRTQVVRTRGTYDDRTAAFRAMLKASSGGQR
jgi:hypothetical protein